MCVLALWHAGLCRPGLSISQRCLCRCNARALLLSCDVLLQIAKPAEHSDSPRIWEGKGGKRDEQGEVTAKQSSIPCQQGQCCVCTAALYYRPG